MRGRATVPGRPGILSALAGCRCPACGARQSLWSLIRTTHVRRRLARGARLAFVACPACATGLRLGRGRAAHWALTILVVAPLTAATAFAAILGLMALGAPPLGPGAGPLTWALYLPVLALMMLMPVVLLARLCGTVRA